MRNAIANLRSAVELKQGNGVGPLVYVRSGPGPQLLLNYYRNTLGHVFIHEAYIVSALHMTRFQGAKQDWLKSQSEFIRSILQDEYITRQISFDESLARMQQSGRGTVVVSLDRTVVSVPRNDTTTRRLVFIASFVWPVVECYWTVALYLRSLQPDKGMPLVLLSHKAFLHQFCYSCE